MFVPISTCRVLLFVALVLSQFALASKMTNSSLSLAGTCEAARHFGPVLRGSLLISRGREAWMAEIARPPRAGPVARSNNSLCVSGRPG